MNKKTAAKKTTSKKTTAKKVVAKNSEIKQSEVKKTVVKKPEVKSTAKATPAKATAQIRVTQTGSAIRREGSQRKTLIGLGLNKVGRSRVLEDTPSIRGMVRKVQHMVKIEDV